MSQSRIGGFRIAGVSTCLPPRVVDNLAQGEAFGAEEVRKVVAMAGVRQRHVVDPGVTAADLCFEAADALLERLGWRRDSITGLILVTQSPDYWLPSSSCMLHKWLGLSPDCAAFDVGLGCSGYPYGLYLAACMMRGGGHQRILMLHGETPSRFPGPGDHATTLLFGDAGSATALETSDTAPPASFCLHTDGQGYGGLIIPGGGFRDREPANPADRHLQMDGAAIFNFTIKRVPPLIAELLALSGDSIDSIDSFVLHQSNRFIMKHLAKKCGLPEARLPLILEDSGNTGGPSVAVTLTRTAAASRDSALRVMMIGYGVGLSWAGCVAEIPPEALLMHGEYRGSVQKQ